jgi:hypothetical protein
MRLEIVVTCGQYNGAVDFKQCLPILVGFLDVPILHRPDPFFSRIERFFEFRIQD